MPIRIRINIGKIMAISMRAVPRSRLDQLLRRMPLMPMFAFTSLLSTHQECR
jgi:hypothetical protein